MNDFLLVLFYQAIAAVNTAVILSGIIWLAKRKDKKDERKPNLDFTPPPIRHSGGYQPKPRWDKTDEDDPDFEKVLRYAVEHECSYRAAKLALASVYDPAEESVKRYERDFVDVKCEKCKYFLANYAGDFGYCVQNEEIKHPYEAHGCFEK